MSGEEILERIDAGDRVQMRAKDVMNFLRWIEATRRNRVEFRVVVEGATATLFVEDTASVLAAPPAPAKADDDDELTPEEVAQLAQSKADVEAGRLIPHEEVRRQFLFPKFLWFCGECDAVSTDTTCWKCGTVSTVKYKQNAR